MGKNKKNALAVLLSLLIAAGLVYFQIKKLNLSEVQKILLEAEYIYILPSILMGILALYIRALRWRLMLEAMDYKVSKSNSFAAICVNYFANIIIPRSGELFRCTSIYSAEGVPVNKSLGTVISERIIDLVCLGCILLLAALLNFNLFKTFTLESIEKRRAMAGDSSFQLLYILLMFAGVLVILWFTQSRWKKSALYQKLKQFLHGMKEGILSVLKLKKRNLFIFYTIVIWVLYYYMTYIMVFSLKDAAHLSHSQGFFILLAGAIGMIIPASGGIGSYHAALGLAFSMMGLNNELGNSFALLVHTPHMLVAIVLGVLGLITIYISSKKRKKKTIHG